MEGHLRFSSNSGRYQIGEAEDAPDLTAGDACEVWLGGQWVSGYVEHAGKVYAVERSAVRGGLTSVPGYYFIAHDGSLCGLCLGMKVRI